MSIFKRLTAKSGTSSTEGNANNAYKTETITSEDIASSIRAELAAEMVLDTPLEDEVALDVVDIDDIADMPEIEPEIDIPEISMPEITIPDMEPETEASFDGESETDLDDIESYDRARRDYLAPEPTAIESDHFKPTFSHEPDTEYLSDDDIYDGPATPRSAHMDLAELRLDVVRISADIESGEELYRRAQQRVESLRSFVEQAEIAGSLLHKLEPENRRLKARNRALESDLISHTQAFSTLEADLEDQRGIATNARTKLEALRRQLTEANAAIEERNRDIETLNIENRDIQIQAERIKTNLDIETRENITMRETLNDLSQQVESLTAEKIEISKTSETLRLDCEDHDRSNEQLQASLSEMRLELGTTRQQNDRMRDELIEIQEKVVSFKSQQETLLMRRDDKIVSLEAIVADLQSKLEMKEEVVQSAVKDVSQLRKVRSAHEVEREKLEKIIESQNYQLTQAEEIILQSKRDASDLDKRYKDVAGELSSRQPRQQDASDAPDIYPTMKERQLAREAELQRERDKELERQLAEDYARVEAPRRTPEDKRSRYKDNPYVSLPRS